MKRERWQEISAIYNGAARREGADRVAYIADACGGDDDLRREVEALLAHDAHQSFLAKPLTLPPGSRIGAYELIEIIGAGGMGIVYRARDLKLQRDVALKVLPEAVALDPDRIARFHREAHVLASLNHPNIAAIHGFEDSGDVHALVLELVEGPTLADRIARGAVPLDEALPIARQIAEALEAAHEQGIIHRDLKPANIKLRPDGTVKVLDFGLAKLVEAGEASKAGAAGRESLSMSPTITSPALISGVGVLLGTAAYMSPEQAKGKPADKRSDIWAFGCVLHEMLTGRRPFDPTLGSASSTDEREAVVEVLAAVLTREPEWRALPLETGPALRQLLGSCLAKKHRDRLRSIGVAIWVIDDAMKSPDPRSEVGAVPLPILRRASIAWSMAAVSVIALGSVAVLEMRARGGSAAALDTVYRSTIELPAGWTSDSISHLALSPDGRRIAFIAPDASERDVLWIRALDGGDTQALAGTEGAAAPFWSPDSRDVAFVAGGKLKRIAATGGSVAIICDTEAPWPGTWNSGGVILFTPKRDSSPLFRVSASGGTPYPVTSVDGRNPLVHAFPSFLPDGRHFLFLSTSPNGSARQLELASLDSNDRKPLLDGVSSAQYADGRIVFMTADSTLMARPFDATRLTFTGDPVSLSDDVKAERQALNNGTTFSLSQTGVLVYVTDRAAQLVWLDRTGKRLRLLGDPYEEKGGLYLSLSPDGRQAAVAMVAAGNPDIVILDERGTRKRFTADARTGSYAVWSPDGTRIIFNSRRRGHLDLFERSLDTAMGTETSLLIDDTDKFPTGWSPDGKYLLYTFRSSKTASDVWVLPLTGDRKPYPFLQTAFNEQNAKFSPDGRWVAYASDESTLFEVFVTPFPGPGVSRRVSPGLAALPRWRSDGKELFYEARDGTIMSVPWTMKGDQPEIGTAQPLFTVGRPSSIAYTWDVSPDGQRFLVRVPASNDRASLTLVVNWPALLNKS